MTVVICRREQFTEAAIVLACTPPGEMWPLVVLDAPPIDEAEYRRRYDDYVSARNARDFAPNDARRALTDAKFALLTPYRWWAKQQRLAGELIGTSGTDRIVMLFDPPHDEFALIETTPIDTIGPERRSVLPVGMTRVILGVDAAQTDLVAFADTAWATLRAVPLPGQAPVRIASADCVGVFTGLGVALALGRRLVIAASTSPASSADRHDEPGANEAVIIEAAPDARRLLGVVYAAKRKARLVVYPQPDIAEIEGTREAIQASLERRASDDATVVNEHVAVRQAALAANATKGIWSDVQSLFITPAAPTPVQAFRSAVTRAVPPAVVQCVGARDLTAFTGGVPYNAVVTGNADWSRKPIGHVPDDAALLIFPHLAAARPASDISFNLIFDPGFFQTAETQNVLTELQARVSPSLVLEGWSATILALQHLCSTIPVDIMFFNTHGADDAIVLAGRTLADAIWPSYKLVRTALLSRPLVFNNSCQSWTGVGREFVLAGARGYIGSLWSIDANDAATYAKIVLARTVGDGATVAHAMRETGISGFTELAYLFVGTAADKLAVAAAADDATIRARLLGASNLLRDALVGWLDSDAGRNPTLDFVVPLAECLWENSMLLFTEYGRRSPAPDPPAVDASIDQLEIGARLTRQFGRGPDLKALYSQAFQLAGATPASDPIRAGWAQRLSAWKGGYLTSTGHPSEAVAAYRTAVACAKTAGNSAAKLWLDISDVLVANGQANDARDAARTAEKEPLIDEREDPRRQRMTVVGRLGTASLAMGLTDDALVFAREGAALADALVDRSEQSAFVADEARAYLRAGDRANAAERAIEANRLAVLAYAPGLVKAAKLLYEQATTPAK